MLQGWLFHETVQEPGRLGASQWPLVGVFDPAGVVPVGQPSHDGLSQDAGLDALNPADCHVHVVGDAWHMGADMARVRAQPVAIASTWLVVAHYVEGTGRWAVEVQYLVVVGSELEDTVERLLRKCSDGTDTGSFVDQWRGTMAAHDGGVSATALTTLLGATAGK